MLWEDPLVVFFHIHQLPQKVLHIMSPPTPYIQPDLHKDPMVNHKFILSEGGNCNVCWNFGELCVLYVAGLIPEAYSLRPYCILLEYGGSSFSTLFLCDTSLYLRRS